MGRMLARSSDLRFIGGGNLAVRLDHAFCLREQANTRHSSRVPLPDGSAASAAIPDTGARRSKDPLRLSRNTRDALTLPNATLFPRTKPRLILSDGTFNCRAPPVTLTMASAPFFASTFMASNTSGEYPVPSRIKSKGPYSAEASLSESSFVLTYRAPSSSIAK
jgi:hypothetical protein